MSIYDILNPLAPVLSGAWKWAVGAAIGGALLLSLWAMFGRRWRSDGVRRCPRCAHECTPGAPVDPHKGLRCTECGFVATTERALQRRRGRRRVAMLGLGVACSLLALLFIWNSGGIFLLRLTLPRWSTSQEARMPNGIRLVLQVDPVQQLGLFPNPDARAWDGWFMDEVEGVGGRTTMWPERARLLCAMDGQNPIVLPLQAPFNFGIGVGQDSMPAVGSPGFGGDIDGDGVPELLIGEVNVGSAGGISWHSIRPAPAPAPAPASAPASPSAPAPSITALADGAFTDADGDGRAEFLRTVHGFRYRMIPGVFLHDPAVICVYDAASDRWVPSAQRMRAPVDRAKLAHAAADARAAYLECAAQQLAGWETADDRSGMLPCPEMIAPLAQATIELVFTGNEREWEEFVRLSWPASPALRDRFLYELRQAIETCEERPFLRTLNEIPEPVPAVGAHPVRSTLREGTR